MKIDVVTLFPSMFEGALGESILKIAQDKGLAGISLVNLRDFSPDQKHRKVDAPPYGGGPGMVIMAEPVFAAVESLRSRGRERSTLVLLTPSGAPYDQPMAEELARQEGLILLCGHYEGFDERVSEGLNPLEISIGDYVLTGGEIPAMVVLDSVVRLIPGVLGSPESLKSESFASGGETKYYIPWDPETSVTKLEHPQYTRPREFRGMKVPEVLLSGDHKKIEEWRREKSLERTKERRPDLVRGRQKNRKKRFRQI